MMDTRHRLCIKIAIVVNILLLLLQNNHPFISVAFLIKCPLHQMHLQKIVGFRPSLEYLTESNRFYVPERFPINRLGPSLGTQDDANAGDAEDEIITSRICWGICKEDDECIAYVHLLDTNECYGFSYFDRTHRYLTIHIDLQLVADPEAIYFEKTCLKIPEPCKNRLWILTKIPGTSLVFQGKKTLPNLVTRRECAEDCLFEKEFHCLSASYAPTYRNNRERFGQEVVSAHTRDETLGRCILSDKDKVIQSDSFRAAPFDEEYIENQCVERVAENDTCSYELYSNSSFIYAEAQYNGLTQKECQSRCSHESKFHCLGITFSSQSSNYLSNSRCWLHSEDIISMGPRSLKRKANSVYMRKVKCLDVQVVCSPETMIIKYTPKDYFRGKIYVSAHSEDCVVEGNGTASTILKLPIGSESKESRCGILRAYEVTKQYQRIFISALIVIQNNANVQTQGDRLIKVGCIMNNDSTSGGDQNETGTQQKNMEEVPNAIALESSVEFSQESFPDDGTALFNVSEKQFIPKISLQIIDLSRKRKQETNDVQIGQNLELQIVAQTPQELELAAPALYDIRATSLQAKTKDNQNYVLLIDEHGCPTDVTVFPALERFRTDSKNILRARFHAFKFAGSPLVGFDVKIHFCPHRCAEMNCQQNSSEVKGFSENWARQRRQTFYHDERVQIKTPVYVSSVVDEQQTSSRDTMKGMFNYSDTATDREDMALPLNFSLYVRGPEVLDNRSLIYGERGILLIADIDNQLHSDGIYINQSLLIALFIFWLCIQIALMFGCCYVIQKYKRMASSEYKRRKINDSLEYLDSRRVRWADSQSGFTL